MQSPWSSEHAIRARYEAERMLAERRNLVRQAAGPRVSPALWAQAVRFLRKLLGRPAVRATPPAERSGDAWKRLGDET